MNSTTSTTSSLSSIVKSLNDARWAAIEAEDRAEHYQVLLRCLTDETATQKPTFEQIREAIAGARQTTDALREAEAARDDLRREASALAESMTDADVDAAIKTAMGIFSTGATRARLGF